MITETQDISRITVNCQCSIYWFLFRGNNFLLSFSRIKGAYFKFGIGSLKWAMTRFYLDRKNTHLTFALPKELFTSALVTGVLLLEAVLIGTHIYIDLEFRSAVQKNCVTI